MESDCGVFTIMFASQLAFSLDLQVIQQSDMPEFRHFIAAALINEREPGILRSPAASGSDYHSELFEVEEEEAAASDEYALIYAYLNSPLCQLS